MTNLDKIRSLDERELAVFLVATNNAGFCDICRKEKNNDCIKNPWWGCVTGVTNWLLDEWKEEDMTNVYSYAKELAEDH